MSALGSWWARLPRDTRDSFFLLGVISAVIVPHAGHLPWWSSALTAIVLGWRGLLAWRQRPLPSRWWLAAVIVIYTGLTWLTFRTVIGREAGITLLVMLMALKTMELRARRDAFVVFFLGFFLVLTQFLYSQSLLMAVWSLVSLWGLLAAVVLAQMPSGVPSIAIAARRAAGTTALGLPVMVLLFVLFPRVAPLWGVPTEAIGRTGLSNQLEFGAMNEIANDESIAMRLKFEGPPPPPDQRYFRGPVLTRFDGKTWRAPDPRASQSWLRGRDELATAGTALRYEMTMEPLRIPVLPLLEMSPGGVGSELRLTDLVVTRGNELQWVSPRPITERLRLNTSAHPSWRAGERRNRLQLALDLDLPADGNPRTRAWAQELAAQPRFANLATGPRAEALATALLEHVRAQDFTYTLTPAPLWRGLAPRHRRVLARPAVGLLRALRLCLRRHHACDGRAGTHRHRLPGLGRRAAGRLPRRTQCQRPCLGRVLGGGTRLGAQRPDRRGRAQPRHPGPGAAASTGRVRSAQPVALAGRARWLGKRSTTAGSSWC